MHAPFAHSRAVKRIFRYIKGIVNFGIGLLSNSSLHLYGFSDADWVGCPDTRRSTTGYCIFLSANCVSWSAKKPPIFVRSSAEAEYRSMAVATSELTWITFLLHDIGVFLKTPSILYCDNLSVTLSKYRLYVPCSNKANRDRVPLCSGRGCKRHINYLFCLRNRSISRYLHKSFIKNTIYEDSPQARCWRHYLAWGEVIKKINTNQCAKWKLRDLSLKMYIFMKT